MENYLENRLIYDELNHYKQHHQVLGTHPVFAWYQRFQQLRSMKVGELFRLKVLLSNYMNKAKNAVRKDPHHPQTSKRLKRIATMEKELKEINHLVNL